MSALTMNTRPGALARRGGFAWLPWALAALFAGHLVMERALHLYKAGPVLGHVLEACGAAAVLIWVWRGLQRAEELPAGGVAVPTCCDDTVPDVDRGSWGTRQSAWDDDVPPGYPIAFDRTGMTVENDREAIL